MTLEQLQTGHHDQFLVLVQDFAKHDKVHFLKLFGDKAWDAKAFLKFAKQCDTERMDWRPKANKVSVTHYVLMEGGEICGYGRMRFPLDDKTEQDGGNLEFYVPPSKRRQGYGALTLNRMLFEAVRAGMARALVTCDRSNLAAKKCIEKNRGQIIEDGAEKIQRYWIKFR